jgi:glutathione S-transferase
MSEPVNNASSSHLEANMRAANQTSDRILWGIGTSRTIRAHWALHELGLDYQKRPILPRTGETQTDEYTALTARQKIPLLQDKAIVLTESVAIVLYLSDTYGQDHNRLCPTAGSARAQCLEWCFFALSELDAAALYVVRRHRDLKHIYGEAAQADSAAVEYFQKQMRTVDRALADGRVHILGNRFSAADIVLTSCLTWAVRYDVPISTAALQYSHRQTTRATYVAAERSNTPVPDAGRV